MDEGANRGSTFGNVSALPSMNQAMKFDNVLQKLETGQHQLLTELTKVDLQLERLNEILRLREQVYQQPAELAVTPMAFPQQEVMETPQSMPRNYKSNVKSIPPDVPLTPSAATLGNEPSVAVFLSERHTKGEDLKAYQRAIGWQRQIQHIFKVDAKADCLTRFASGPVWTFLCMAFIILNIIVIGVETQLTTVHSINQALSGQSRSASSSGVHEPVFKAVEIAYLVWMIFEALMNLYVQKKDFLFGQDWQWNAFDIVMIVFTLAMQFVDVVSVSFLRIVRLCRLGKILRAFRVIKFLRSVRSMLISISGSIMHLFSAIFVMCIFMYIVALIIMQSVTTDIYEATAAQHQSSTRSLSGVFDYSSDLSAREQIDHLYGSLDRTMMTLFLTVSGGIEWSQAAEPIVKLGTEYGVIWTSYIAFMMFGMLNVLTGIFVDSAISVMNNDKDNMILAQLEERTALITFISNVFRSSDTDGSGFISEEEMDALLQDNELIALLNAIGIDSTEARGLFQLLDDDASGTVSIDEFVTGFLRLKGSAKAVDIVSLMYENRKTSKKLDKVFRETRRVHQGLAFMHQQSLRASGQDSWDI